MCSWHAKSRPARWYDLLICVCRDTASTSFARPIIRARRPSRPSRRGCSRWCELSLNVRTGACNLLAPTKVNLPDILNLTPRRQLPASYCSLYDTRLVRIQSIRDRIYCRGARLAESCRSDRNVSTLRQTMAAVSAAEALRSDLIGRIDLRVVGDSKL